MDIAERTAEMSHAVRLKVGAVIVKDDRILSMGYNGTPSGWPNLCEDTIYCHDGDRIEPNTNRSYRLITKPEVLHAESNAISKLARSTDSGQNAVMFCTHAPCMECAKLIYQSGISSVYFGKHYRDDSGLTFLRQAGVHVEELLK